MDNRLIVINAGSSSVKFTVYQRRPNGELKEVAKGKIDTQFDQAIFSVKLSNDDVVVERKLKSDMVDNHSYWTAVILDWLKEYMSDGKLLAIGHRIVHGGILYSTPVVIDKIVLRDLEALIPLAPLHQPHNLAFVRTFVEAMPNLTQVVCFDTAFHRCQPEIAQHYALPRRYFDAGIRRYGFHGLSYDYVNAKLYDIEPSLRDAKIIVAHLGNGSSLCAIKNGKSIATTMGFSPLDGLVMGTRCGQIDPGVLLYLLEHNKLNVKDLEHLLYYESGLLGVSGISSDMRDLLASGDVSAKAAIDLYVYRIVREIGSLISALGGLDALVFTGGIGENAAEIRMLVCKQMAWLGLDLNDSANIRGDSLASTPGSKISVWIVPTDENAVIARQLMKFV